MRDETRNRCVSAELIENEAARIPDPNHWQAIALREMARLERECWEALFPAVHINWEGRQNAGNGPTAPEAFGGEAREPRQAAMALLVEAMMTPDN